MKSKLAISILGLGIVFTITMLNGGCGQSQSNPSLITNFPHADGYSWQYREAVMLGTSEGIYKNTYYFSGITTLESGLMTQNQYSSRETVKELQIASLKAKTVLDAAALFYVNNIAAYRYGTVAYPTSEGRIIIPLPLNIGNRWQRGPNTSCEAVGSEQITVPAGTFNAIKVAMKYPVDEERYEWYVDGVGLVKSFTKLQVFIARQDSGTALEETYISTLELISKNF